MYDINIAVRDIILYFKHLMHDAQQKKAKLFCFDQLDDETYFWLKDFSQKIVPMKLIKNIFEKKGCLYMSMYFFLKRSNPLFKRLYLSSINQCDQGMIDTLSLGKAVLKQLKVDEPQIQKLFAKSDNASCYQGNYLPQALYQLCKEQDITLVRDDYHEPCKGKGQCNCECAGLNTILKTYVDSGNNVECANDIFIALN